MWFLDLSFRNFLVKFSHRISSILQPNDFITDNTKKINTVGTARTIAVTLRTK